MPGPFPLLRAALAAAALTLSALVPTFAAQTHTHATLFAGGTGGYHSYRIPSLMRTSNGTLIAVCEGRMSSASDWGNINLVFKRSTNNGSTWSALGEIVGAGQGGWTNPTMVYDPPSPALPTASARTNGRVWLFFNWNSEDEAGMDTIDYGDRRTYLCYSDDNGATWSTRVNMTGTLTPSTFKWDAVGPGNGIRMTRDHVGRLVVPATRRNFYSDDHGTTWHYALVPTGTGESTLVECSDGILHRNDRATSGTWEGGKRRWVSYGTIEDGFSAFTPHNALLDPKCEGSILRYNFDAPHRIVFLNSASTIDDPMQEGRSKMFVRLSYDDGASWPISRQLYDWLTIDQCIAQGKGGYSSMTKTADYCVGILVEVNPGGNRSIDFHKVNLEWIRDGAGDP